jgi:uncharacterized membrane protein
MMKRIFLFLIVCLCGCNYETDKSPGNPVTSVGTYSADELTFQNVYDKVFGPSCVSCHGQSGGVNLQTYANAKNHTAAIYQATIVDGTMPPGDSLSSEQLGLLNAWIQAGAPEKAGAGTTPGTQPKPSASATPTPIASATPRPAPTSAPGGSRSTFAMVSSILQNKCTMCHAPGRSESGIPLVTRANVLRRVTPGNANASSLVRAIKSNMPPRGYTKVTSSELSTISQWINNGAKD